MIGKLVGFFSHYYGNIAIIDIIYNGCSIGYEVAMKSSDIATLRKNDRVTLYIKEFIKEDDDVLYGFLSFKDKCLFEELTKLSGLGPKTALAILSAYPYESIIDAIVMNNCDFFSSVSGIGKKLANRIPNEMSNSIIKIDEKIADFDNQSNSYEENYGNNNTKNDKKTLLIQDTEVVQKIKPTLKKDKTNNKNTVNNKNTINDSIEALIALGFSRQQIYTDVFNIVKENNNYSVEDVIKEFLKSKA